MEIIKTICGMCHAQCGINVHLHNGRIIEVSGRNDHIFNDLCEKGWALPELVHSPLRITSPLLKINGEFNEVSWDEALDAIARKLAKVKEEYGPEALVVHLGVAFVRSYVQYVARRFSDLYGTPNYTSGISLCFGSRVLADALNFGSHITPQCSKDTKCVMVWGNNPTESMVNLRPEDIYQTVRNGARLIVIDPISTALAKQADIHVQPRPGTDCALALGIINVIIRDGLYDRSFVKRWTVGFNKLAKYAQEFYPEQVEQITWVPAKEIESIARLYSTNKPAAISIYVAMDHSTNGVQAIRAIGALSAITGNIDIPGGNTYLSKRLKTTNIRLPDRVSKKPSISADYPLFSKFVGDEASIVPVIEQILSEKPYPVKALIIGGNNAALTWPNTKKVLQSLGKLDLFVVIDIFMTETAKLAEIVLPGTSFIERTEIRDYNGRGYGLISAGNKALEPVGKSMEDWKIWVELGRRMGYAEYFPWDSEDELLEHLLRPSQFTLEQFRQEPCGIYYEQQEYKKYERSGFNTPSGKVELYSKTLKEYGYDPLPTFHEPIESPASRPDLVDKYPLMFVSGIKRRPYTHSQYRNLPSLRKLIPEPVLYINPKTAVDLDIKDGDWVEVRSLRGPIKLRARHTEDVHPRVVAMLSGWSEANANLLTDDMIRDPISGFPGFRSIMCNVVKIRK